MRTLDEVIYLTIHLQALFQNVSVMKNTEIKYQFENIITFILLLRHMSNLEPRILKRLCNFEVVTSKLLKVELLVALLYRKLISNNNLCK
jgi:hypothetical protein